MYHRYWAAVLSERQEMQCIMPNIRHLMHHNSQTESEIMLKVMHHTRRGESELC
jgi:hypothetical protein